MSDDPAFRFVARTGGSTAAEGLSAAHRRERGAGLGHAVPLGVPDRPLRVDVPGSVRARRSGRPRVPPRAGRDLRRRREHGEPARDLAGARARRDPARGVGVGGRPRRRERGRELLVRGEHHGFVRPAGSVDRRSGPAARQLLSRTTRPSPAGVRCIRRSSRKASRRGSRATTWRPCTTSGPMSPRSWRRILRRARTGSTEGSTGPWPRRRSPPDSSAAERSRCIPWDRGVALPPCRSEWGER